MWYNEKKTAQQDENPKKGEEAMENMTCQDLAKKLGIGKATVSRAVRHCSGVDSETRQRILQVAKHSSISIPAVPCSIYCILPDTPHYFWNLVFRNMLEEMRQEQISVKYNIYTSIFDHETVLLYLDEAVQLGARVVVLSASLSPAIREKLREMQKNGVYVILLSEYGELSDCVYVGANSFRDGEQIGRWFCQHYPQLHPMILSHYGCANALPRIRGFMHAIEQFRPGYPHKVPIIALGEHDLSSPKTIPARLAALFSTIGKEYSCVYMPFGNIHLPLSIMKAGWKTQLPVLLSHDCFTEAGPCSVYPGYTASCNQDIVCQVSTAMEMARAYLKNPVFTGSQKFCFIPSNVYSSREEALKA